MKEAKPNKKKKIPVWIALPLVVTVMVILQVLTHMRMVPPTTEIFLGALPPPRHQQQPCHPFQNDHMLRFPVPPRGSNQTSPSRKEEMVCRSTIIQGRNNKALRPILQLQQELRNRKANNTQRFVVERHTFVQRYDQLVDNNAGYYKYWDHDMQRLNSSFAQIVQEQQSQTNEDCQRTPTSLEILQDVIQHHSKWKPHNDDTSSCFRPNVEATRKLLATHPKIPLPLPILNVGFPKSGSTTLADFFDCAGFRVGNEQQGSCMAHAIANLSCPHPVLTCGSRTAQVYMQMDVSFPPDDCFFPQIQFLDEIHAEYPHATFVMAMRPMDTWIRSVRHWTSMARRLSHCQIPGLQKAKVNQTGLSSNDYRRWACNHVEHIRRFVQAYPSHTLIEVDLYDANTTSALLSQLFEAPASCWGHSNARNASVFKTKKTST